MTADSEAAGRLHVGHGLISDFLHQLHGETTGYIEVRVIEDRRGGVLVDRKWYASPAELDLDFSRLREVADRSHAGIFSGVLPRREAGCGKAEDVADGLAAWADLDFKDYKAGEQEARRRLAEFPVPPSIMVRSGHGLHGYWVLRERR